MQLIVNVKTMIAGAKLLDIPVIITEQYPQEKKNLMLKHTVTSYIFQG